MALTRVSNISLGSDITFNSVTADAINATDTVQVGSGLTISPDNIECSGTDFKTRNIKSTGIVTATSFRGDGAQLTGIDATALKDSGGNIKLQASTTGASVTGALTIGITTIHSNLAEVHNVVSTGIITATSFSGDGSALTGTGAVDERSHSGSAFLQTVLETEHVIHVTENTTLTSLYSDPSTMYTKRRSVVVDSTKSLIIADGEEFVINPANI